MPPSTQRHVHKSCTCPSKSPRACVRAFMHACTRACTHTCMLACMRVCVRACAHAHVRECTCVCVHAWCMHAPVCMCVYACTHTTTRPAPSSPVDSHFVASASTSETVLRFTASPVCLKNSSAIAFCVQLGCCALSVQICFLCATVNCTRLGAMLAICGATRFARSIYGRTVSLQVHAARPCTAVQHRCVATHCMSE